MRQITGADGTVFEFKLGYSTRAKLRAAAAETEYGVDFDVTRIIDENSRVPELLASSEDYVIDVACGLLVNPDQKSAFLESLEDVGPVYDLVVAELLGFTLPPKRPAVTTTLKMISRAMETSIADAFSDLLTTSNENSGDLSEPLELAPEISLSRN
tara:strand:- start:2044 stop:2511 length:468 start_codon:yes stop_codon:yes gene_type:complete